MPASETSIIARHLSDILQCNKADTASYGEGGIYPHSSKCWMHVSIHAQSIILIAPRMLKANLRLPSVINVT